ncbi:MAG: hypothetical protein ABI351_12420 [Herbaspirillum sp.]
MTISQRLNDAFTLAVEGQPADPLRVEAEALEGLALGTPPLDHDAAFSIVQRWLDLPLDRKPACEYERFMDACRLGVSDYTGFLFWLSTFLGEKLYPELVRRQPELAGLFRTQFLKITAIDYRRWLGVRGTCYPYAQFLARGILEFVDRVLGEGCQDEVISDVASRD